MKGAVIILSPGTKLLFKLSFANLANLLSGHCHVLIIILRSQIIHGDKGVLVPQIYTSFGSPPSEVCALGGMCHPVAQWEQPGLCNHAYMFANL